MRLSSWLLAALTGSLLTLTFQPFNLWPLAWIAFVPLFHALDDAPDVKSAANLGAVAGLAFYIPALKWIVKVFGPLGGAFWCVFALWLALHATLVWRLKRDGARALPAAAAVLWVGLEYFRSEVWKLDCSWLALGYSQMHSAPLRQTCALIGVYGLSGVIVGVNAAFSLALKKRRAPAFAAVGLLAVMYAWGSYRLSSTPDSGEPVSVAAVQDENYDLGRLDKFSLSPEAKDAKLLVWPEYAFTVQPGQEERYRSLLSKGLKGSSAVAVLGGAIFPEDLRKGWEQNFAWVLASDGALLGRYDKHHPIPYVETRLKPNRDPRVVATPLGLLGVQICYDLDFEDTSRLLLKQGARLFAVPDLDPREWGPVQHRMHSDMSAARALESGLWIVRAASSGVSQLVDPLGYVRAELAPMESGVLTGTARLTDGGTLYSRIGWLLPQLCFLLTAAVLALLAREAWDARRVR